MVSRNSKNQGGAIKGKHQLKNVYLHAKRHSTHVQSTERLHKPGVKVPALNHVSSMESLAAPEFITERAVDEERGTFFDKFSPLNNKAVVGKPPETKPHKHVKEKKLTDNLQMWIDTANAVAQNMPLSTRNPHSSTKGSTTNRNASNMRSNKKFGDRSRSVIAGTPFSSKPSEHFTAGMMRSPSGSDLQYVQGPVDSTFKTPKNKYVDYLNIGRKPAPPIKSLLKNLADSPSLKGPAFKESFGERRMHISKFNP